MVQFGALIVCRTFKNYFGQFVWIEKSHYNSRVSIHEALTKNIISQRQVGVDELPIAHFFVSLSTFHIHPLAI